MIISLFFELKKTISLNLALLDSFSCNVVTSLKLNDFSLEIKLLLFLELSHIFQFSLCLLHPLDFDKIVLLQLLENLHELIWLIEIQWNVVIQVFDEIFEIWLNIKLLVKFIFNSLSIDALLWLIETLSRLSHTFTLSSTLWALSTTISRLLVSPRLFLSPILLDPRFLLFLLSFLPVSLLFGDVDWRKVIQESLKLVVLIKRLYILSDVTDENSDFLNDSSMLVGLLILLTSPFVKFLLGLLSLILQLIEEHQECFCIGLKHILWAG